MFFLETGPLYLSQGLDDRPLPPLSEGLDPPLRCAPFVGGFYGLTGIRWMMS